MYKIPNELLVCRNAPPVPNPETATQADVATAYTGTYFAWDSCKKALTRVSTIIQSTEKE